MPTPDSRPTPPARSNGPDAGSARGGTILHAVLHVMRDAGRPLTAQEVAAAVQDRGLYTFKSAAPAQMVRAQLRRHAEGLAVAKNASKHHFRLRDDGRFELLPVR